MAGRKRHIFNADASSASSSRKRRKTVVPEPEVIPAEDEEQSLGSILAEIEAQEQREALSREQQDEWRGKRVDIASAGPSAGSGTGSSGVIDLTSEEDDEAMARRLASEWAADASPYNGHNFEDPSKGKCWAPSNEGTGIEERLHSHKHLFTGTRKCRCGAELLSPRGHVTYSAQVPPPTLLVLLHVPCKSCKANYCRGCLTPVSCPLNCKGKGQDGSLCPACMCCAEVRAIAMFEALGGFDRQFLSERATAESRAKEAVAKHRSHVDSVGPGGTGFSTGGSGGHDYSPRGRGRGRGSSRGGRGAKNGWSPATPKEALAMHWDEIIVRALSTITEFLPSQYSGSEKIYDVLPHECMRDLLCMSQLPQLLGDLLRNDSVTDWIARSDVYYATLRMLKKMADCELILEVLVGQRWELEKSSGLENWMWSDGEITWAKDRNGQFTKTAPLYAHFKKLTRQCETFIAGAFNMFEHNDEDDDVSETMVKATSLCGDIMVARDEIERATKMLGKNPAALNQNEEPLIQSSFPVKGKGKSKGKEVDVSIALEREYIGECERLAFKHVTLSKPTGGDGGLDYPEFNYAAELRQSASATRNPRDRLHLIKELAVMATSLPQGVWMRVDEVRNDVIKIMIAGPEGTPYAGGLFEFDCFIPLQYPNTPPLMHLRTTGGGRVRFNPNLYNTGKVCLSLLGTWQGRPEEQWAPGQSSLLQVVVSIQSMILVDLPYFNEPGFGKANPQSRQSIEYNKNVSMQTMRWAMVEWLKDEHKNGIWVNVIRSHFTIRKDKIRKCVQNWAKAEPRIRNYTLTPSYIGPAPLLLSPPISSASSTGSGSSAGSVNSLGGWSTAAELEYPVPRAAVVPTSGGMDLLKEFDIGMEKVEAWPISDE